MGKIKVIGIMGVQIFLALVDGLLTYIATPDLSNEGNFLVSYFGLGWGALFTANVIVISLIFLAVYYSFVVYQTPAIKSDNMKEYISMLMFNRPDRWYWAIYKFGNKKVFFATIGYVVGYSLIVGRLILIAEWILYLTVGIPHFYSKIDSFFFGKFFVVAAMASGLIFIIYWFTKERKKSAKLANLGDGGNQ